MALAAALFAAACSSAGGSAPSSPPASSSDPPSSGSSATVAPSPQPSIASAHQIYVSVGDSYAAGYQPTGQGTGHTTRHGFAYQVVTDAQAKGYRFRLVNFGCAGATTASVLQQKGCARQRLGPGAPTYPKLTQAVAAEQYLRQHRGRVGLITVSLGGNDVTACQHASDPTSCVTGALSEIQKNVTTLVTRLRAAAGPKARIVGTTYPDVLLGLALSNSKPKQQLATASQFAFRALINPTLQQAYQAGDGSFADVTAATGGYGSMTKMTSLKPYGRIPVPVATICRLTYFCQYGDIHPRTAGYAAIAQLVVGKLPTR